MIARMGAVDQGLRRRLAAALCATLSGGLGCSGSVRSGSLASSSEAEGGQAGSGGLSVDASVGAGGRVSTGGRRASGGRLSAGGPGSGGVPGAGGANASGGVTACAGTRQDGACLASGAVCWDEPGKPAPCAGLFDPVCACFKEPCECWGTFGMDGPPYPNSSATACSGTSDGTTCVAPGAKCWSVHADVADDCTKFAAPACDCDDSPCRCFAPERSRL
jgi:hypothetical protein